MLTLQDLLVGTTVATLVGLIVVPAGRVMARSTRRFFGTATLWRALAELVALHVAITTPWVLLMHAVGYYEYVTRTPSPQNRLMLLVWLLTQLLALMILPLWLAFRLAPAPRPAASGRAVVALREWRRVLPVIAPYGRAAAGMSVAFLLAASFDLLLLPGLLARALKIPWGGSLLFWEGWPAVISSALAAPLYFVLERGAIELIRWITARSYRLVTPGVPGLRAGQKRYRDRTRYYPTLVVVSAAGLALWLTSFALHDRWRGFAYIPPVYQPPPEGIIPTTVPTVLERPLMLILGISAPYIITLLLGLVVAWRAPLREPSTRAFTLTCVALGVGWIGILPRWGAPLPYLPCFLAKVLMPPALLDFALTFPSSRATFTGAARPWRRWIRAGLYLPPLLLSPLWLWLHLRVQVLLERMVALMRTQEQPSAGEVTGMMLIGTAAATQTLLYILTWVVGGYAVYHAYRQLARVPTPDTTRGFDPAAAARAQLRWVMLGGALAATGLLAMTALLFPVIVPRFGTAWGDVLPSLALIALPIATAIAVVWYDLFNVENVVQRLLIYVPTALILSGLAYLALAAPLVWLGRHSTFVTLLAFAAILALAGPLVKGIQRVIRRAFYRAELDLEHDLPVWEQKLASTVKIETFGDLLAEKLPARAQLLGGWFYLSGTALAGLDSIFADGLRRASSERQPRLRQRLLKRGKIWSLALQMGGPPMGTWEVAPRASGESLSTADKAFFAALLPVASATLANLLSVAELHQAQRDIHDRALSNLTATLRFIEEARHRLGDHTESVHAVHALAELAVRRATRVLRNITDGPLPQTSGPPLQERIKETLQIFDGIGGLGCYFEPPETPPSLLPAVEEALQAIVEELLTNVLKYSKATRATVVLSQETRDWLSLVVADNGDGFDPNTVTYGRGLRNMEERVAELGGTSDIRRGFDGGARIEIRVPV